LWKEGAQDVIQPRNGCVVLIVLKGKAIKVRFGHYARDDRPLGGGSSRARRPEMDASRYTHESPVT
jgi:hypothetical protein